MAKKRFTDTQLHRKAWFRKLPLALREAWRILCAECDEIGVWEIDMEGLNFSLGLREGSPDLVTVESLTSAFGLRVIEEDKIFIPGFVGFQYGDESGKLKKANKLLPKITRMLSARCLPPPELHIEYVGSESPMHPPCIPHASPMGGVKEEEEEKEEVEEKEFDLKRGSGGKISAARRQDAHFRFDFNALFDLYPRCQKKTQSVSLMAEHIQSAEDYSHLEKQIRRYREHVEREGTPFSKQLTFPNWWLERAEWLDERTGTTNVKATGTNVVDWNYVFDTNGGAK